MTASRRIFATLLAAGVGCFIYGNLFYRAVIIDEIDGPGFGDVPAIGPGSSQEAMNYFLNTASTNGLPTPSDGVKKIAFGTRYWGQKYWKNVFRRLIEGSCPVSSCTVSFSDKQTDSADALVFNAPDLGKKFKLPKKKNPGQVWVLFSAEPPPVVDEHTKHYWRRNNVFDLMMTYRLDSDVVMPYGAVEPIDPETSSPLRNRWLEKRPNHEKVMRKTTSGRVDVKESKKGSKKTSTPTGKVLASWMVSNCKSHSGREKYVKKLQKYIGIDIYGKCGSKKCGERQTISTIKKNEKSNETDPCTKVMESYYFYFSFENALCKDYVSEKFYKILKLDVVPVVFGSANYTAIAPPNSFINAMDFDSPKTLAEYLKKVAASEQLYNSFFEWKTKYRVELGHPYSAMVCGLCARLQGEDDAKRATTPPETDASTRSLTKRGRKDPETSSTSELSRSGVGSELFGTGTAKEQPKTEEEYRSIKKWFDDDAHCVTWTPNGLIPAP